MAIVLHTFAVYQISNLFVGFVHDFLKTKSQLSCQINTGTGLLQPNRCWNIITLSYRQKNFLLTFLSFAKVSLKAFVVIFHNFIFLPWFLVHLLHNFWEEQYGTD